MNNTSKNTDRPYVISVTATDSKVLKGNSKCAWLCHNTERAQKVYNWVKRQERYLNVEHKKWYHNNNIANLSSFLVKDSHPAILNR